MVKKNDPFWHEHQPGDLWNCKCDWAETDEPTEQEKGNASPAGGKAAKGLEGNPAETGKIFSDDSSYFQKASKTDSYLKNADEDYKKTMDSLDEYLDYNDNEYQHDHFSGNGGWMVTDRKRILQGDRTKQEKEKFAREHAQSLVLAKNRHKVVHLEETPGMYDILLDYYAAELKSTGAGNLLKRIKKAVNDQGAQIVAVEFDEITHEVMSELAKAKRKGYKVLYWKRGEDVVKVL